MALLKVRDECTKFIGHRFLNSHICLVISLVQLLVCCWAVAQHVNSYFTYDKVRYQHNYMESTILKCDFLEGSLPLEAVDAVIFDIRLFHYLWGIRGCVAEYLDGGFGRLAWCVSHSTSLICSLPATFISHPRPCYFWPLLVQQSAYGICLLVLLLAALPRIVVALAAPQAAPLVPILFYFTGTALNFFHLYVYWHWYWHVTAMWNSAVRVKFGGKLVNANNRSRRDKPRLPKEEIDDEVLHYLPAPESTTDVNTVDPSKPLKPKNEVQKKIILPPPGPSSTISNVGSRNSSPTLKKPLNSRYHQNRRRQRSSKEFHHFSSHHQNEQHRQELLSQETINERTENDYQHQNGYIPRRIFIANNEYGDDGDEADIDEMPTPPPPIYATRLTSDSYENRRIPRRRLPQTPNLPMHGEVPRIFYLPNAHV